MNAAEDKITKPEQETNCDFCGDPLKVGDFGVFSEEGEVFCCWECSESFDYYERES